MPSADDETGTWPCIGTSPCGARRNGSRAKPRAQKGPPSPAARLRLPGPDGDVDRRGHGRAMAANPAARAARFHRPDARRRRSMRCSTGACAAGGPTIACRGRGRIQVFYRMVPAARALLPRFCVPLHSPFGSLRQPFILLNFLCFRLHLRRAGERTGPPVHHVPSPSSVVASMATLAEVGPKDSSSTWGRATGASCSRPPRCSARAASAWTSTRSW